MQSYPAQEEATLTVSPTYLKRGDRWEGKQSGTSPWLLAWRRTAPQQRLFKAIQGLYNHEHGKRHQRPGSRRSRSPCQDASLGPSLACINVLNLL